MDNLAPIALFVYNRPEHTKKTIKALSRNCLAKKSKLYIFSDGPKDKASVLAVAQVRKVLEEIEGFESVEARYQEVNSGLASSIITGVSSLMEDYGKVIVLEDDIVTSRYFLQFMNEALKKYSSDKEVWHISGWNYSIDTKGMEDSFFWRTMNCWGWATWSDRWVYFEKEPQKIIKEWKKNDILSFNLNGAEDFWAQVIANEKGKINTWAIFWYATIFANKGLCLNPSGSLVNNIGNDGSGENCGEYDPYNINLQDRKVDLPSAICIDSIATERIANFYIENKLSLLQRVLRKFKRQFFK